MKNLIGLGCLALVACSAAEQDAERESAFDPLVEDLDKAKEVEQQVLDQKHALDKAIEEQEVGNDDQDN